MTTMTIDILIAAIFTAKTGDSEFILSRDNVGGWFAAIGNKSEHICIGEAISYTTDDADFYAEGETARETLENLLTMITRAGGGSQLVSHE